MCEEKGNCDGTSLNRQTGERFKTDCPAKCQHHGKALHKALCRCSQQEKQLGIALNSAAEAKEAVAHINAIGAQGEINLVINEDINSLMIVISVKY